MSDLIADCPRCGAARITFDLRDATPVQFQYEWKVWYEAFCVCRNCAQATLFVVATKGVDENKLIKNYGIEKLPASANNYLSIEDYISLKNCAGIEPPDHLPKDIESVFNEGATCLAVACFNAAATMFRLCVDMATASLLPQEDREGLNAKIRRSLGLRLQWLFDKNTIPESLRELSHCIKEDANDGAHVGTLGKSDAEDLVDFTVVLLERLYTEPKRLELAKARREERRAK